MILRFSTATFIVTIISLNVNAEYVSERPMYVQKFEELNIEFLTEVDPLWNTNLRYHKGKPILLVSTQPKVYPPIQMIVTSFPGMEFTSEELDVGYKSFLNTALANYGINPGQIDTLNTTTKVYGDLTGREITFEANVHGTPSDIKVFLGMGKDRGPVLLQAITLKDKISHIERSLQRSWDNIRYLN